MENAKYAALVRLVEGEAPKEIADDLGISYGRVIKYRTELTQAEANSTVAKLLEQTQGTIDNLAQQTLAVLPEELQGAAEEDLSGVVEGVTGLKRLETELQETAHRINTRIRHQTMSIDSVGELGDLTEALCKLQSAFFGKGTQVNVQTNINNGGTETYAEFLNDHPGKA